MGSARSDSLYRTIAEEYRRQILSGGLPPQSPFPSQIDLSKIHGTSVVTIQKAMALLVNEGLVFRVKRKGTFVSNVADRHMKNDLSAAVRNVFFIHNNAPIDTLSHGILQSMLQGMAEACSERSAAFHVVNFRENEVIGTDTAIILWDLWGWNTASSYGSELLKAVTQWKAEGHRILTLHHYFPQLDIPRMNVDNIVGAYQATQHLISLGHAKIGMLLSGQSLANLKPEFVLRLQGYRLALSNYGIAFDPDVLQVQDCGRESEDSGYEGLYSLMARKDPPTAVFAGSDFKAYGAMMAARELGLDVPNDLSIVGFDGYAFGEYTTPPLTTIDQNFYVLGKSAGDMVLTMIESEKSNMLIAPSLIVRGSTAGVDHSPLKKT